MKPTWKVILLIMLAGFVGWRVMAQEPQGNGLSGGQQSDPNGLSEGQQSDPNVLSGAQQSDPAAQKNSGGRSATSPLSTFSGRGGEPGGTVKGVADGSALSITKAPITSDDLSMQLEKARQIASQMESASIHRANEARLSMEHWDPTDVAGRDGLRKELRLFVIEAFKARHALQRMEVALLEKKLQAMNRKLEEQEARASEIIERRIDDLLNPNLRWDDSAIKNSTTEGNGPKAAVPNDVNFYAVQDLPLWSKEGTSQHIELLIHYLEARMDSTKNGRDKIGTYDAGRGMLVVRGDARKHEQIAQILTDLRANSGSPAEEEAKDKAYSKSDLRANSTQSDEDLAMEKLVKTYSIADLPIWSKDGKKQHVDLLLSYLRLNVDPPSWESKVARAAYNAEMLALVVQGTSEVHNGIKAALSRLRGQTNLYGNPNAPTSNIPSRESTRAEQAPGDEAKLPEAIQALTASIVTVTRIEPADGDPANKPVSHAGVVVDSRGYIVIPLLPSQSKLMQFAVRFADQQEVVGQLVGSDESLKFGVLKIERPQPVTAISLARSREARVFDRVILVPSPASKELRRGQVTSTTVVLGEEGSNKLIETDVTFPLSEYGSLMVSEAGEPLGISMACRADPTPESIVLPLINVLHLITAAIDKLKDVPLVTMPASPPAIDLHKPVQITLQPVPPLAKSLVELFAPRGAKVLEYEEGKRLKIEAPPLVLEELGKLLELVGRGSTNVYDLERIQEAKAVSPPQLFGAKTPAGVLTYDGNVQEWVGGDRRAGTILADGDAFKPVPNATIHLYRVSPIAKGGSGYQFEEIEVFKSDKQGHFKINIPDNLKRFIPTPGTIEWDDWESVLLITTSAPGFATDSTTLAANRILGSIELIRGTSIRGHLVDEHEKPIVGAHVTVNAQSRSTSREEMDEWLRQTSKEPLPKATLDPADTDALLAARKPASIANHHVQWIPTQIEGVVTDQDGRFVIDGIGPDDMLDLSVECFGYNNASIKVIGRDIETVYSRDPFASGENIAVHGCNLKATLIASDRGSPHSRHRVIKGERK